MLSTTTTNLKKESCPALAVYVMLRLPPLDSKTRWTGELWSKNNLLNWQKKRIALFSVKLFLKLNWFWKRVIFWYFFKDFSRFLDFFQHFQKFWIFGFLNGFLDFFFGFFNFLIFLAFFLDFFVLFGFQSKSLRLLLKVTKVSTGQQKWAKTA